MLWVKTLHILFVIAWFAGLFYLPRIYVNLAQTNDAAAYDCLVGMARRLYRFMTPLGVLALVFGLWLYVGYGIGMGAGWMHAKLLLVIGLVVYHGMCARMLTTFERRANMREHRYYRWFNEVPVLMLVLVLILVVVKPF
ncbi:CopD family protein [Yanghanlia caeni]|uniref:Protoporphyrinogen IX oxidase n=1 Tax=Yanghanlia caeni TaxID=3064283 RepID=A0ABU1D7J5_9BURK|nr:CopD family protein [Alcaligenaceae bacterium LG-2]NGR07478.1 CopD family protein [bacterium SGD-2]HZH55720.1 CopD family protein [Burkholderiaceae bacterium]